MIPWHSFQIKQVFQNLNTGAGGLSSDEAKNRLNKLGPNTLPEGKRPTLFSIFISQFQSPLIYILFAAGGIVYALGETTDSLIIFAVLIFNAIIGTIQEGKAQNVLAALKRLTQEILITVVRDGSERAVLSHEIAPGDIIVLQEGEKNSADARIISSHGLKTDEASLTGESEPVNKTAEVINTLNLKPADQANMVFKGTHIVSGSGRAVVVETGSSTVIGKIAREITEIETEIPLKMNMRHLSKAIIIVVLAIASIISVVGTVYGYPLVEIFKVVVSLSISIIPEGLPVVITLVLAMGVSRMSKQNVLVKKLQAVEALGQAKIIAVDKTGTITKNELVIRRVWVENQEFDVSGTGYEPKGQISLNDKIVGPADDESLKFIAKTASLCANANLYYVPTNDQWHVSGDPTEAAMLVFGEKLGFNHKETEKNFPLINEIPFDYKLKYHATLHQDRKQNLLTVLGAPESVLRLCNGIEKEKKNKKLSDSEKRNLHEVAERMSRQGLRVLAVAVDRDFSFELRPENLSSLEFIGFLGMQDALRPEVPGAMEKAHDAGVRVIMITGDHKLTAQAIAEEAGIYKDGDEILTGQMIDLMTDDELAASLDKTSVFARVTPEHKLKIINAYKKRGETIAMTGDGVNDAPSLVAADLGVAMGAIGTEVAKEASDIILLDDNFGTIVSAIEEGRSIYKTIKRVILYLFSTGLGEVLTITTALFLGYPLPILASQIIWLNFVTDGFLDVALAMEPRAKSLLSKKFEKPSKYIVDSLMLQRMFIMALPMTIITLWLFKDYAIIGLDKARTVALITLAFFQWFNAWNCKSESKSIFKINPFNNKPLVFATVLVLILQIVAVYHPVMQRLLHTVPLNLSEWLKIAGLTFTIVFVEEARKFFLRRKFSSGPTKNSAIS